MSTTEESRVIPNSQAALDVAERLMEDERDSWLRDRVVKAGNRGEFGSIAANVASDRYSAGSTAARIAIYIVLTQSVQAAVDFVADMEHHEGA